MFRRGLVLGFVITFFGLFVPFRLEAASPTIVINSYKVATAGKSTDEFVELYNNGSTPVNISGWQLSRKSASGTKSNLVTIFPSVVINPGESLIVGHADSTAGPDIFYTTSNSIAENNSIVLFSDQKETVVDLVGFGEGLKAENYEGKPVPAAGTDVWIRQSGRDTGNNYNDFKKVLSPVDLSGLALSEIMPAPESGEEWIEIYNAEVTKDIGGLVISDKLGAVKKYTVPSGTQIKENEYLVFYKDKTGITLNDDGDGVIISDPSGNVIDDTGESYGKVTKGYSYAFDGSKWVWTQKPTPGALNIIAANASSATISSKKRLQANTAEGGIPQKGTMPQAEVLGATAASENSILGGASNVSDNDRILGFVLIGLAVLGGLAYTIFVNKEKLSEVFIKEREKYNRSWEEFRTKIKGWRSFSFVGGFRRRKDAVRQRFSFGPWDQK